MEKMKKDLNLLAKQIQESQVRQHFRVYRHLHQLSGVYAAACIISQVYMQLHAPPIGCIRSCIHYLSGV